VNGDETLEAITRALEDAKIDPKDIDFIDGTAISCPHLDMEEANGFKKFLS
jgi:hypothetical protein